jgi:hypothetical protein
MPKIEESRTKKAENPIPSPNSKNPSSKILSGKDIKCEGMMIRQNSI